MPEYRLNLNSFASEVDQLGKPHEVSQLLWVSGLWMKPNSLGGRGYQRKQKPLTVERQ